MNRFQERLRSTEEAWDKVKGLPESGLLRRVLLRDLARFLHAERSRKGTDPGKNPDQIRDLEKRVERLLEASLDHGKFQDLLANPWSLPTTPRRISPSILQNVGGEKFSRFDRKWEQQIVSDAVHCMWTLWYLDAWIEVQRAEVFHDRLATSFWPEAIVLFAESSPGAPEQPLLRPERPLWKGRWLMACSQNPAQLSWKLQKEDGLDTELEGPQWTAVIDSKA